jgi:hypothetical protein
MTTKQNAPGSVAQALRQARPGRAALLLILALAACSSTGGTASTGPAAPSKAASSAKLKVTSTLDGLTALPLRIHWQAFPSVPTADVSEVDFLIDGRLAWVKHHTPYLYGGFERGVGNWLVTSFLTPGEHTFTVRVITASGQTVTDTGKASVTPPPAPPAAVAGTWTRVVTAADVQKATSDQPPPPGRWQLQIGPVGWQLHDPTGGGLLFDVRYTHASGNLQMRSAIDYPPYPQNDQGGFCNGRDPLWEWTYSAADGGRTLTLHPVGHDPCGDRIAILSGVWTRTGK